MTTEHGGGSSSTIAFRNKLHGIWQHLKAKSSDFASTLNFITSLRNKFRSVPAEAGLFLLICSIYPYAFWIPIEDLVVDMMGLGLFEDEHDMFTARSRVHDIILMINDKKYSRKAVIDESGLSPENSGSNNQHVKVLNGAFDSVKSVVLNDPSVFRREIVAGKWPEFNIYKECYGLSLVLNKVNEHPSHFEFPNMALLHLQHWQDSQSLPIDFFEGMKELHVLSLDVPSLPQSLDMLRNLRTLRLKVIKFEDTSSIGGLVNLEFLSISALTSMEIPMEIGQLEKLKLLDLKRMSITYFPPGILSKLVKLEELHLPVDFKTWGCKAKNYDDRDEFGLEEQDGYGDEERIDADISETDDLGRINASLIEIVSPLLNTLQVCVPRASVLPKSSPLFKNIREFSLKPNNVLYQPFGKYSGNVLQLSGDVCDIKESGVCDLLRRVEDLNLIQVQNLQNVICQLKERSFPNLMKMIVSECDELQYIVDGTKEIILLEGDHLFKKLECLHLSMLPNFKEICHEKWKSLRWFSNLSQISIRFCPKLKYLFPLSIFERLTLKRIEILDCNGMEGILYEHKEHNIPLPLFSIENLDLCSLPRLISLLVCKDNMIDEVFNDTEESLTTNKVSTIKNRDAISHLEMYSFLPCRYVGKWFGNLKSLKIAFCDLVKVIFFFEENHATSNAFNSLEVLELHGLRNLVHIWFRIPPKITAFKNLQLLVVSDCYTSYLLTYRVAKLLVQLQKICISRCEKMEELITLTDVDYERKARVVLPRLKHMELQHMPNLRILFGRTYKIELPLLESLKLKQCDKMKSISSGLTRMPMLDGVEVNGSFQSREDLYVNVKGVTILHSFTFADLKIATKSFSSDNFLGEGSSSEVFRGWIDKKTFAPSKAGVGLPVAIKRLKSDGGQEVEYWKSEVDILSRLSHPNLMKLLGGCSRIGELLLVYEFLAWGSLRDYLFTGNPLVKPLSWRMRIKIAIRAARGLNFLHTSDIIHRNVSLSNILLDKKYNAKISKLSFAKLMPVDGKSEVSTGIKGTLGYLDPAYLVSGQLSVKSDVYSFGVVLLELMTGLNTIDISRRHEKKSLVEWLKPILSQKRDLEKYTDSKMEGKYSFEAMSLMADLVLECLQEDPKMRPAMGEVLDKLQEIVAIKQ